MRREQFYQRGAVQNSGENLFFQQVFHCLSQPIFSLEQLTERLDELATQQSIVEFHKYLYTFINAIMQVEVTVDERAYQRLSEHLQHAEQLIFYQRYFPDRSKMSNAFCRETFAIISKISWLDEVRPLISVLERYQQEQSPALHRQYVMALQRYLNSRDYYSAISSGYSSDTRYQTKAVKLLGIRLPLQHTHADEWFVRYNQGISNYLASLPPIESEQTSLLAAATHFLCGITKAALSHPWKSACGLMVLFSSVGVTAQRQQAHRELVFAENLPQTSHQTVQSMVAVANQLHLQKGVNRPETNIVANRDEVQLTHDFKSHQRPITQSESSDPQLVPIGNEFLVSANISGHQAYPSIVPMTNGGWITAWSSYSRDNHDEGIYAQLYDLRGDIIWTKFLVEGINNKTLVPSLLSLANSRFLMTWSWDSYITSRDYNSLIYAQIYDHSASKLGNEYPTDRDSRDFLSGPGLTRLVDGSIVLSWADSIIEKVFIQRFSSNKLEKESSEIQVNDRDFVFLPTAVAVASLVDGGFVVTWQGLNADGDGWGILAQRFAANNVKVGDNFQVNTYTASTQANPDIIGLADGGWVIVWQSAGQDRFDYGIYAQRYDVLGAPIGGEFQVNTYILGRQWNPHITSLIDGGWIITWESNAQDGSGYGIYAQRYDKSSNRVGIEVQVNTYTLDNQWSHGVASLSDGGLVIVWRSDNQYSSDAHIYAQRFKLDHYPQLQQNKFPIIEGQHLTITPSMLRATDRDDYYGALQFEISNLQGGYFAYSYQPEVSIMQFLQQNISDNQVIFIHTGGELPPGFKIIVSDGFLRTDPVAVKIQFISVNHAPRVYRLLPPVKQVVTNEVFNYMIPSDTFIDPENKSLTLSSRQSNGKALPVTDDANVQFNPVDNTFGGLIKTEQSIPIEVIAIDPENKSAVIGFVLIAVSGSAALSNKLQKSLLEIALPPVLGFFMTVLGSWVRERHINKQWRKSTHFFHNALREKLKLSLGTPTESYYYIQEMDNLLDKFVEQKLSQSSIKDLSKDKQEAYAIALVKVLEHSYNRKTYKHYSRLFHGCLPNPLNLCSPSYTLLYGFFSDPRKVEEIAREIPRYLPDDELQMVNTLWM